MSGDFLVKREKHVVYVMCKMKHHIRRASDVHEELSAESSFLTLS